MWPVTLSGRLLIVDLVSRYLTNYLIRRELTPNRIAPFTPVPCDSVVLCGISNCFQLLSPCPGQIAHALLTRPPLGKNPKALTSFDLHVLSTPPAFVLSQDQTLVFNPLVLRSCSLVPAPTRQRVRFPSVALTQDRFNSFSESTVFFVLPCTLALPAPSLDRSRAPARAPSALPSLISLYRFQGPCSPLPKPLPPALPDPQRRSRKRDSLYILLLRQDPVKYNFDN